MNPDHVPLPLQRRVRDRTDNRGEYCGISQSGQEATFHVDHVHPRRDGGTTISGNLALACVSCSLRKGARTSAPDPETGQRTNVFNPRTNQWNDHFRLADDFSIVGTTAVGRASVQTLAMNRALAVAIRKEEARRGKGH